MRKFYLYTIEDVKQLDFTKIRKLTTFYTIIVLKRFSVKVADGSKSNFEKKTLFINLYRSHLFFPSPLRLQPDFVQYTNEFTNYFESKAFYQDVFDTERNFITPSTTKDVGTINWLTENSLVKEPLQYNSLTFDFAWALMNQVVGVPLLNATYVYSNAYDPFICDKHAQLGTNRLEIIKKLGPLVRFIGLPYQGFIYFWYNGINQLRQVSPSNRQEHDNLGWGSSIFPTDYYHGKKGHTRVYPKNRNTLSTLRKPLKYSILKKVSVYTGWFFYEFDLKSAHLHILIQAAGKDLKQQKLLEKHALTSDSYWDALTDQFLYQFLKKKKKISTEKLSIIPKPYIRKAIKNSILAIMNGSKIGNLDHIGQVFKDLEDENGNTMLYYTPLVSEFIISLEISKIIKQITLTWSESGSVWPMGCRDPYVRPDEVHKTLTSIYCGVELLAISYLIQYITTCTPFMIPLSIEADGLLVATKHELKVPEMARIIASMESLVLCTVGMHLPITLNKVA